MKLFTLILSLFITAQLFAQTNWALSNTGITQYVNLNDFATAPNGDVYLAGWHYGSVPYAPYQSMFKSTNNGLTWATANISSLPVGDPKSIIFAGNKLLLCGTNSNASLDYLYASTDFGATWSLSNTGIPGSYKLNDFAKAPNGDIYVAAALYNSSSALYSPHLLKSIDNGANWTEITLNGLASIYPTAILVDNTGRLYLSGTNDIYPTWIYTSSNSGYSWTSADGGIPADAYVNDMTLGSNGTDVIACGTDYTSSQVARIYKTTNHGTNWSVLNTTGLTQSKTTTAIMNSAGTLLLAGNDGVTSGSSLNYVYRSDLPQAPVVSTSPATDVTDVTADIGGNVTSDGSVALVSRGICWGTSTGPTVSSQTMSAGNGTGIYSVTLTNLQPSTTYYARAYATNSVGTSYGNEITFTTAVASGIQQINVSKALEVHPVPTSDLLYVPVNTSGKSVIYTVYDLMGKAVLTERIEMGQSIIDITNLPKGSYFLQSENTQRKKILKQ